MRQLFRIQTLWWALYAIALFLIYHLLVKPAFLDGSWIALLIFIPVLGLSYFLIHPDERKPVIVFSLGFLLLDRSLTRVDTKSGVAMVIGALIAIVVIAVIAKWYGKLRSNAVLVLVVLAVLANVGFNRDNLMVLNHFYVQAETDRLYNGEWVDYFPVTLVDVDGDGTQEIVTYGNSDELPLPEDTEKPTTDAERKALAEKLLPIKAEPVSLYVLGWRNGKLERMNNNTLTEQAKEKIAQQMPTDFPGFPYYTMKDQQLIPNVQRQSYAEGMLQVGTAPYRALLLDLQNIEQYLAEKNGAFDLQANFGPASKYQNVVIAAGTISGAYDGQLFETRTLATKIRGTMRLPDGQEGLIIQGEKISIVEPDGKGSLTEAYTLTKDQISLANSEYIPADIDHDGTDELMIAGTPSYILKPTTDGKWDILWKSYYKSNADKDESFRFNAFATVGDETTPEIVAQAKSWISSHPIRYLSGFTYTDKGLEQNWRMYLPLINVQVGDIDGDKENEIIASIYDTHRLIVLKQHDLPVLPAVILLFIGLVGYGVVRRFRHA